MELKGRQIVKAALATLWKMLMDTDTLSKIIPGITKLEKTGQHSYASVLELKLGPFSISFEGDAQMEDIADQKGFTLKMQQNSNVGKADSVMKIGLVPGNNDETEVIFDGNVKITGILGSMGDGVLSTAANAITRQFFANLDRELAGQRSVS